MLQPEKLENYFLLLSSLHSGESLHSMVQQIGENQISLSLVNIEIQSSHLQSTSPLYFRVLIFCHSMIITVSFCKRHIPILTFKFV